MPRILKKPARRASYRITLDPAVVRNLRVMAANETLAAGRSVTWLDVIRRAAAAATEGVAK
jgi:hypothetical protein